MHVLVDHHQHQVVDLLVGDDLAQHPLDAVGRRLEVGEGGGTQLGEGLGRFLAYQDQRPKCRLLGADQDQPAGGFGHLGARETETLGGGIGHVGLASGRSPPSRIQ
jgi:hypothetical protein